MYSSTRPPAETGTPAPSPDFSLRGRRPDRPGQALLAPVSLLAAGLLLGVTTNLAKLAQASAIPALAFLTWSLAGAAALLVFTAWLRGHSARLSARFLEYSLVAGSLFVAGTNLIFFSAVAHLGVGFIALMLCLPPLLTYAGALLLRMERFCPWRAGGVVLALGGTALLVARQWSAPGAQTGWIALSLLGPLLLSAGNLYRSRRWPPGASPHALAPAMLLAAVVTLLLVASLPGRTLWVPTDDVAAILLIALQVGVFAGQFLLLFILQRAGGPVLLSLMGAVAAVFGVPIAMLLLGEPALPALIPGAGLILAGIACLLLGTRLCAGPGATQAEEN